MNRQIHIQIKAGDSFAKDLATKPLFEISGDDIWDLGYDTEPYAEYDINEKFPNCCGYHSNIRKNVDRWIEKFPFCCDEHKKLTLKSWFKKELYLHIPNKIIRQL